MSQLGWIKVHRNLRNSFSSNKKLNVDLWVLYVFLAEQAAWDDFGDLKRGQIKIKACEIQREIFPDMSITRVQKLIQHLIKTNHIKSTPVSKISKEGSIVEICQYGYFSPEKAENKMEPNRDPTGTQLEPSQSDKYLESLPNNHVNLGDRNPTGTQPEPNRNPQGCSLFIEERNKEIKEEKEEKTISNDIVQNFDNHVFDPFESEIEIPMKKEKPKRAKKTPKTDLKKASGYIGLMFKPDNSPETKGFPWPNKTEIEVIASSLIETYGLDPIKVWYDQARAAGSLGRMKWTPSKFDSYIKSLIEPVNEEHSQECDLALQQVLDNM
jgi:hypothetical protein